MTSASDASQTGLKAGGFPPVPDKLKLDAIIEAVFEIQFDHNETPEVVVGSLASSSAWKGYLPSRQPAGNLPIDVLTTDPAIRFAPTLQLDRPVAGEIVRIGPRVVSLHFVSPYPNWGAFAPRISNMVEALFSSLAQPFIHRLGLRYVNALTPAHGFNSFSDLTLTVCVRDRTPSTQILTGYILEGGENTTIQVRVASDIFVAGTKVEDAVAYVDVDVQTIAPPGSVDADKVTRWAELAHSEEKKAFFQLWPDDKIEHLRA